MREKNRGRKIRGKSERDGRRRDDDDRPFPRARPRAPFFQVPGQAQMGCDVKGQREGKRGRRERVEESVI